MSQGKDVVVEFMHVDKKLKVTGLADIVLDHHEKLNKENFSASQRRLECSIIGDSWQAIDFNPNQNLANELIDFAEAFCSAIKHLKERKNTAFQFKDQSRLDCVKETLQGYQDSYRRECRTWEDMNRMREQKQAASSFLYDLYRTESVHDSIEKAPKEELLSKPGNAVDWWIYSRLDQAKLEQNTSIDCDIKPTEVLR